MVREFGCLQPCKVAVAIVVVEVVVVVVAVVEVVVSGGSRVVEYQTQQQLAKRASTFNHRIAPVCTLTTMARVYSLAIRD